MDVAFNVYRSNGFYIFFCLAMTFMAIPYFISRYGIVRYGQKEWASVVTIFGLNQDLRRDEEESGKSQSEHRLDTFCTNFANDF